MAKKRTALETKELLIDSFLTLYKENDLEQITIKMITDHSGVNRGTFYIYFNDIYDIKQKIEDDLFNIALNLIPSNLDSILFKGGADIIIDAEIFRKNINKAKILIGEYGKSDIIHRIKCLLADQLKEHMSTYDKLNEEEILKLQYYIEYLISANAAVIQLWVKNDLDQDIEFIKGILLSSMLDGPASEIKRLLNDRNKVNEIVDTYEVDKQPV